MDIAAIASSLNVLGLVVFGFLVKGLKERIDNLTALAREQKETLEAVRTRATELDQLRKDYRQGLDDFKDLGDKLNQLRAQVVTELEQAVKSKDEQLARTKQRELDSLDRIPELEARLTETIAEFQRQIKIVAIYAPEINRFDLAIRKPSFADVIRRGSEWAVGTGNWEIGSGQPSPEFQSPLGISSVSVLQDAYHGIRVEADPGEHKSPPKKEG